MGVVHFKEVTGRSASEDQDTNREYTRTFQVLTNDPLDGADQVRAYPEVPVRGQAYSYTDATGTLRFDLKSVCVSVRVTQDDGDNFVNWTVVAEYRGLDDPVSQPAEVEWDAVPYQVSVLEDTNGKKVVNAAGDPFESGLTVDGDRFTATIVKNVVAGDWDPIEMEKYQNTLNKYAFLTVRHPPGFLARTCKLKLTAKLVWYPDRTNFYWRRTAKIEYRADGWTARLRNAGYRAKVVGALFGGAAVGIIDSNGTRPTTPQLLDASGFRLLSGTPTTCDFEPYREKDWGPLNLGY